MSRRNELRLVMAALLIAGLLAVMAGCGTSSPTSEPATIETEAPTEEQVIEEEGEEAVQISIAGSTTVQPLAESLAEAYTAENPNVQIDIQGGGSSVGVKSAGEGTVDIGQASREVKDSEKETYPNLKIYAIARDGIAIAAHPDVSVDGLSRDEVRQIFAGEVTNWSEVGGSDANITVVAREEGSGTRGAFEDMVMGESVIADTALLQASNGAIKTTVSTTPNAVGFLSFGYLDDSVKVLAIDGVEATVANAVSGEYPVVRPLNMMTDGEPTGEVKDFLDFIMSDAGQEVVAEEYIPVGGAPEEVEEEASAEEEVQISVAGSTTVQPLTESLAEAYTAKNPNVQIDIQGGGSSVGVKSAGEGTVDIGQASREVKDSEKETYPNLKIYAIARDGIAMAAHPDASVDGLSKDEVRQIFAGEVTNWSDVGGSDANIVVVAREEGSGTRGAFEDMVMGESVIADTALLQPSNGAVKTTVSTTPNAVGFLSFGYLDDSVKALAVDGVEPTVANAVSGEYPVVRPLNMMTDGEPTGEVKDFLDFIMSDAGQQVVAEEYIPVQ